MSNIAIIGAGVIGLSVALRLQQDGHAVTIIARDFPSPFETVDRKAQINYTSQWGGAHNRWVFPGDEMEKRDHAMALQTYLHMEALAKSNPEAGITFLKGIEYLEAPGPAYANLTHESAKELGAEEFRLLSKEELPEKVSWGCEYRTWCVNPMVYCSFLLRRLSIGGCKMIRREVSSPVEVFAMEDMGDVRTVVNCSGMGFGDSNVFVTRGQTCVVANPCSVTVTRQNADGTWTFCVPRNFDGGTVIGGTKEPDDWSTEPSLTARKELLDKFAATYPSILEDGGGEYKVLADIVGRRPTRRGGMRLEKEETVGSGKCVVHAYGLGGRGFELSWGVAEGVLKLLK